MHACMVKCSVYMFLFNIAFSLVYRDVKDVNSTVEAN